MPLRYDIPIVSDLVFVSAYERVTAADGAALGEQLLADTRLAPEFRLLARLAEIQPVDAAELSGVQQAASRLVSRGLRRTAVVAADDAGYAVASRFAAGARELGVAAEVFRDDIEAVSWLFGEE